MQEEFLKKRTLYLIERGSGIVLKRDGPSVLIERKYKAPVRIPADYIDKVIIYGNVELDAFSITLFTSKHVPILILGRHGESSIVLPYTNEIKDYSKYQSMMLASKKLVDDFKSWILTKRAENQKKLVNRLFKNITVSINHEDSSYRAMINKIKPNNFVWALIKEIMANFLIITILSRLINSKLDPHIGIIYQGSNYGLVFDIYYMYEPFADYMAFQFFYADGVNIDFIKNPDLNTETLQMVIDKFEKKKEEIEYELNSTISHIFSYLRILTP